MRFPMAFDWINLLLPVVLAVHNADEYARYDDFVNAYHPRLAKKLTSRPVIRSAAILLTLFVALQAGLAYVYKGGILLASCKVAIFALLLNAISHCVLSLKRRRILPGTLSAVLLVMPYSVAAIVIMRAGFGDSYSYLLLLAALGAITVPLAVILFLWIGYGISQLEARNQP
jgi:Protein of unknown function with HXXEE motif